MAQNNNRRPGVTISGNMIGSLAVSVALIISSAVIGANISKLNKTIENTAFTSTVEPLRELNISSSVDRQYLTESEAIKYLNLKDSAELRGYISNGEITGYILNGDGAYSFDRAALDKWFAGKCEKVGVPQE